MRSLLTCLIALAVSSHAQGQYQKMSRASSINLSGSNSYFNLGWGKQLSSKYSLTLSGFYFRDEADSFSSDNFGANLGFDRWLLRIGDAYISGGTGIFLAHTDAESALGTGDGDVSFGFNLRGELEFYPTWWFIIFGEVKQFVFFGSDFFNSKFIGAGGIKFVF